ncbi:hypothetical protein Tco_0258414, partial [Tanacetum coccineum]
MDPDEYWPEELDRIVEKKCLFKLFYSEYNVTKNNHTYRCDSFSEDVELINHFKNNFIDTESDDEESSDELAQSTTTKTKTKKNMAIIEDNKAIIKESSDEHVSDMHTTSKKKINKAIIEESRDERDLDMQTPTK